jgi:hypothetical protein
LSLQSDGRTHRFQHFRDSPLTPGTPPNKEEVPDGRISRDFCAVILIGLFLLFRSTGRFGQRPSQQERMRHNGGSVRPQGPRADGLD